MTERDAGALEDFEDGGLAEAELNGVRVLIARTGGRVYATGATCPHKGAPLAKGALVGTADGPKVICPFHHAAFALSDGALLEPPACDGLASFEARVEDGRVLVDVPEGANLHARPAFAKPGEDGRVAAIVGAGAAGQACAEALRREGFEGRILLIWREDGLPYDRTALSKGGLTKDAASAEVPLREASFYDELGVELRPGTEATALDPKAKTLSLRGADGEETLAYDFCLLAPGSFANRLPVEGAGLRNVFTLRALGDAQAIVRAAEAAAEKGTARALLVGSSFIAMEAAASLLDRGLEVTVASRDQVPFARLMGERIGRHLLGKHAAKGLDFRPGREVARFVADDSGGLAKAVLDDGAEVEADLALMGVGVKPATGPFENLGLDEDGGIEVDTAMRVRGGRWPGLFAAGDVARFPYDPREPSRTARIEHWRVAMEQGWLAAAAMLGRNVAYAGVPFFWSQQRGPLHYLGHAEGPDEVTFEQPPEDGPFAAWLVENGRKRAMVEVGRGGYGAKWQHKAAEEGWPRG